MRKTIIGTLTAVALVSFSWGIFTEGSAIAEERIEFNCSNQVYEAFGSAGMEAFSKATGISYDLNLGSSGTCVLRVLNGFGDIASTAQPLAFRHKANGFVETPF